MKAIKRPSLYELRVPVGILVFALVFVFSLFWLRKVPHYLAYRSLSDQAKLTLRAFQESSIGAQTLLASLPSYDQLNCQNKQSGFLAHEAFQNPYIRWIGVAKDHHIICSSESTVIDIGEGYQTQTIDDTWALASIPNAKDQARSHFLFIVQNREDVQYMALMEPLLFDFLSRADCFHCISYSLKIFGDPPLESKVGDGWSHEALSYSIHTKVRRVEVLFTLSASQSYVDMFRLPGQYLAIIAAAIIALLCALLLYLFMLRRVSIANLLKQGLRHHEFFPYYQPIVDSRNGSILGAEAVARWRTKDGRIRGPAQFIQFAEENNYIQPITDHLLKRVIADIKTLGWQNTSRYISINVTPEQVIEPSFCPNILQRLKESGIPPKNLALEITERRPILDLETGRRMLTSLVSAGIEIELDDAGTGFGGFSYIQELPISTMKVDKMFIDTLRGRHDAKREVLDAIIEFAKLSGLKIVAEGVETPQQVEALAEKGVYAIQGFVYAPPMPMEELKHWHAPTILTSHLSVK